LNWRWFDFQELGVENLYDALALRCRVFILEQGAFLDPDGADRQAVHLLGRDGDGVLQAYLRVCHPGVKFLQPSIGRVITSPEVRGSGLGRALVELGVAGCDSRWPGQGIQIGAQQRLERFYEGFGFTRSGPTYSEDGIPHLPMIRR
jgi:ElaA protein